MNSLVSLSVCEIKTKKLWIILKFRYKFDTFDYIWYIFLLNLARDYQTPENL